jgi:transglutaminase-like putative cysteine protease
MRRITIALLVLAPTRVRNMPGRAAWIKRRSTPRRATSDRRSPDRRPIRAAFATLGRMSPSAPSAQPIVAEHRDELAPTPIVDSDHPAVRAFAETHAAGSRSDPARAVALYYAVRDGIRYDPYGAAVEVHGLRASATLERGRGWCVAKAVLLAAACRAVGIPARLGFADVRNHLSTARMREHMKTDLFYWHGYTSILLGAEPRWVKATPAFNIELCEKFGLLPLEFDGESDSLYHPFDREGRRHMEYVNERGEFTDVPLEEIVATFREKYPGMSPDVGSTAAAFGSEADFEQDVEAETSR